MEPSFNNSLGSHLPIREYSFQDIFSRLQPRKMEIKLKNSVFRDLSTRDIRKLCKIAKTGKRKFSEKLMIAGEENQSLYLLTEGSCLIRNGGKFFAEVDAGHFLGEISIFNDQPISADVVSRGDVEFLRWDRSSLNRLFARRPGLQSRFYSVLMTHMANRLQSATEMIVHQYRQN